MNSESLRVLAELRGDPTNFPDDPTNGLVDSVMAVDNGDSGDGNSMGDALAADAPGPSDLHGDEAVAHALRDLLDPR